MLNYQHITWLQDPTQLVLELLNGTAPVFIASLVLYRPLQVEHLDSYLCTFTTLSVISSLILELKSYQN